LLLFDYPIPEIAATIEKIAAATDCERSGDVVYDVDNGNQL